MHHDHRLLSQSNQDTATDRLPLAIGPVTCQLLILLTTGLIAFIAPLCFAQQILDTPLTIEAQFAQVFRNPDGQHAVILERAVHFRCGENHIIADQAVVWIRRIVDAENASVPPQWVATIYAQGHVEQLSGAIPLIDGRENDQSKLFRLATNDQVLLTSETRLERSGQDNEFYQLALRQREILINPAALLASPERTTTPAATESTAPPADTEAAELLAALDQDQAADSAPPITTPGQPSSPEELLLQQTLSSSAPPAEESAIIPPDQASPEDLLIQLESYSAEPNTTVTLPEEDITPETLLIQRPAPPIPTSTGEITFAEEMLQAMQPPVYPEGAQAPLLQFGNQPTEIPTAEPTEQPQRATVHLVPQG